MYLCEPTVTIMKQKNTILIQPYHSPCGDLIIGSFGDSLCLCDWASATHRNSVDRRLQRLLQARYEERASDVIQEAARQLDEYFDGKRTAFEISLLPVGTEFQKKVWLKLQEIPYGKTTSYGELARQLGKPGSFRAVANANGANAISIFIPCHRIIGSNHLLTGYAGGTDTKRFLLDREASVEAAADDMPERTMD